MSPHELTALAVVLGQRPDWVAYTLVDPRPYGLGFLAWNATQWATTRDRLGLGPDWPSALFTHEHLATCAAAVPNR